MCRARRSSVWTDRQGSDAVAFALVGPILMLPLAGLVVYAVVDALLDTLGLKFGEADVRALCLSCPDASRPATPVLVG